jgi:hypothetical protein
MRTEVPGALRQRGFTQLDGWLSCDGDKEGGGQDNRAEDVERSPCLFV